MEMFFQRGRLYATTTVTVLSGDYEFEGNPKLNRIDKLLTEIIGKGQAIYPTITAARAQGHPAIFIMIDGPAMDTVQLKAKWKRAVCNIVYQLERSLGSAGAALIHFSDGTSAGTFQLEQAERDKCVLI